MGQPKTDVKKMKSVPRSEFRVPCFSAQCSGVFIFQQDTQEMNMHIVLNHSSHTLNYKLIYYKLTPLILKKDSIFGPFI